MNKFELSEKKPKAALYHVDVICVDSRSILADTEDEAVQRALEQTQREYGHSFEYQEALVREVLPNAACFSPRRGLTATNYCLGTKPNKQGKPEGRTCRYIG